jgi:excisionase family DNA binding protein
MDRLLLRPSEVAEVIGVGRSKVYELLATGELPSLRIGKCRRVCPDALHLWIQELQGTEAATDGVRRNSPIPSAMDAKPKVGKDAE